MFLICSVLTWTDDKWKTSQTAAAQEVLGNLLGRVWFERMWTLQELLLAKHATVMCGNQSMAWESLFDALELIEDSLPLSIKGLKTPLTGLTRAPSLESS